MCERTLSAAKEGGREEEREEDVFEKGRGSRAAQREEENPKDTGRMREGVFA